MEGIMGGHKSDISRLFSGSFPALEDRLLSRLPGSFDRAWGREHVLLVPSNELREHLLRRLSAKWEGSAAGSSIMTLYDFTVRLLKHRGFFPRELPPAQASAAMLAAVREVYGSGEGDFAAISSTPGFVPALSRTMEDFEEGWLGEETLRAAEARARVQGRDSKAMRWGEWRRLFRAVESKITAAGGMSRRRIFQEAVAGFEQPGYPFRVTLYGFYDFTRLQWTLVDALLASGLLDAVYFPAIFGEDGAISSAFAYAAVTWDRLLRAFEGNVEYLRDDASPGVLALRERAFSPSPPDAPGPFPFPVLSAPHEEGEMRLAARRVRQWQDSNPGEEILLVGRHFSESAVPAWERMAAEYGIRTAGRLAVPLASVPPVRVLLQMIEAAEEGFPRRKVIDILSSPYRRQAGEGSDIVPRPDLWDVWSRESMVVSGDDWEKRLARRKTRRTEEETEEGEEERRAQMALLQAEIRSLRNSLRPVRAARGYRDFARAIRSLLLAEFRMVADDTFEAERDRRAVSAALMQLDDIERIPEGVIPWPPPEGPLAWFRTLLSEQRLFLGDRGGMRIPGAVVAGDLFSLRGVTADRTLFLSVNEDLVPAQIEEDPLLPDEDRAELNRLSRQPGMPDALSLRRGNAAEEKLLFSLPAASSREEVAFSVLRADADGAARRPSRYLLLLISQFAGPGVFSEDWAKASATPVLYLHRSPFATLAGPEPLSPRETELRDWRDGIPPTGGRQGIPWHRIAGTLAAWADREAGISLFPDPWTGIPIPRVMTASALDELVKCPYRYFLRYMVKLSPAEEPEEGLSLTPPEMGTILHDALRRIGRDVADGKGWGDPGVASQKAFERFARDNPTGLPGLFRLQCRGVESDVADFVEWERRREKSPEAYRVEDVERTFEADGGSGFPAFRGRVDRVDRGSAGEVEIIDYKYRDGKNEKAPIEGIRNGLSHQIPVYLVYARALSPSVRASLFYLKGGVRTVTVTGSQWEEIRREWAAALAEWIGLVTSGYFPPLPHHRFTFGGKYPPRYCDACPYKDHCRVSPSFEGMKEETGALVRRVITGPALRRIAGFRPVRDQ
jgi:RecB family exonuclease